MECVLQVVSQGGHPFGVAFEEHVIDIEMNLKFWLEFGFVFSETGREVGGYLLVFVDEVVPRFL